MIKHLALTLCACLIPVSASASFRADDLSAYHLPDCVVPNQGTHPGPVNPRVAAPSDAAQWLPNRQWDIRSPEECQKVMKPGTTRRERPVRDKASSRPNQHVIPQK